MVTQAEEKKTGKNLYCELGPVYYTAKCCPDDLLCSAVFVSPAVGAGQYHPALSYRYPGALDDRRQDTAGKYL